jgi:hypothetical protein
LESHGREDYVWIITTIDDIGGPELFTPATWKRTGKICRAIINVVKGLKNMKKLTDREMMINAEIEERRWSKIYEKTQKRLDWTFGEHNWFQRTKRRLSVWFKCWILGHQWYYYSVIEFNDAGKLVFREGYNRCSRCGYYKAKLKRQGAVSG